MEAEKEIKKVMEPKESKGLGSGIVVGVVVGIALFLMTVQLLHMAR